jgi:hypothetical protein
LPRHAAASSRRRAGFQPADRAWPMSGGRPAVSSHRSGGRRPDASRPRRGPGWA